MKQWMSRNAGRLGIALLAVLLFVWVISGDPEPSDDGPPEGAVSVTVGLTDSRAEPIERLVVAHGHVEPEQIVQVRAQTAGEVSETPVEEGERVVPGEIIVHLGLDDREARLSEARAAESLAENDYEAVARLADQGFQARLAAERASAELEAARARVAAIELDIERTTIESPIGGVLDHQIARRGDVVGVGEPVAEIVENHPLRAVVQIPQHRVREVTEGLKARVTFVDGESREGVLRHVASIADEQTRTFRARVEVPNPERDLPAGTSVTVEIPVETVPAHALSPALISQDDDGRLGVKIAQADGEDGLVARFVAIDPVRATRDRVWVTGLPEEVRLISVGQGFVRDGDAIDVAAEDERP